MDLHAWITQQVDATERADPLHRPDCDSVPQVTSCCGTEDSCDCFDTFPCDCNGPSAVLRRCEADRRILTRHRTDPDEPAFPGACEGCGRDDWGLPGTENINDCPELLDLAHAHGLTDEILAGLDRPTAPGLPADAAYELRITSYPSPPITTSDVPEALRGPHWKP